ncbi:MAG: peptide ABC transporter substrate-binding protein [Candidatus Eremiobacteraeota bacterium]|nr:peptide ABC transporter substrate-binding protein [Candidatus Eremiobacteraeota bacterium]
MKLRLVAFVLALSACGLLSGCSKVGVATRQQTSYTVPGTLRYAEIEEPTSLNPLLRLDAVSTDLDMFIHGFFFNLDDKANYVPELATEVPSQQNGGISKDGLTITYHLRHGVKWQDGPPFTSHDVIFTVNAVNNPKTNLQSREGWDHIASVEAVGPYEVRFHLKKIYAPALATFFCESGLYPVLPAHLLEQYPDLNYVAYNSSPVGLGPFKFVKWVHGDHIELTANPTYWRGPPKLHRVIFKVIPKETTILVQLKTHELDAWFRAPSNLYDQIKALEPDYKVEVAPSYVYSHLDLSQKNPLLQDLRIRRAINYAIDKQTIIDKVTHGVHARSDAEVSKLSWAYNPNVMHYEYDPAKAKALLREAGWTAAADGIMTKNGERLTFNLSAVTGGATGEATEGLVQQQLKAVGIDARIKNYPAEIFFAPGQNGGILQTGKYDIGFFAWVAGADPDGDYSLYACDEFPPAGQNNLFWCDPKLSAALTAGRLTYDQAERKKAYAIAQSEIASQSVTIVLWFQRQIFVTSPHLKGFIPAPATTSNWNTWEWSME